MAAQTPDVLTDPLAVIVDLVSHVEPGLDQQAIRGVAQRVAVGRAKRRRLAQALADNPSLLLHGRSPAPRAVGDLLIALRQAGVVGVSAPVCAACAKAAYPAASRAALVLRGMRPQARAVRALRENPTGRLP